MRRKLEMLLPPRDLAERLSRERPLVIMACANSGAELTSRALRMLGQRMLDLTSGVRWRFSKDPFRRTLTSLGRRNLHLPPFARPSPQDLSRFQLAVYRLMCRLGDRSAGWGWSLPETYLLGNFVAATFPRAHLVHQHRDGRDVALARRATHGGEARLERRVLGHLDLLDEAPQLQAACSWGFQVDRFLRFSRHHSEPIHTLVYEAWLRDPVAETQQLCDFAGLTMNDGCRDMLRSRVVERPRASNADPAEDSLRAMDARIAGTLRELGYSAPEQPTGRKRLRVLKS